MTHRAADVGAYRNSRDARSYCLFDGTGNSAGKLFKTNVWRLYQALDLSNANQIAPNIDGRHSLKPLRARRRAFGWGPKRTFSISTSSCAATTVG